MSDISTAVGLAIGNSQHGEMSKADETRWNNTIDLLDSKGFGNTADAMRRAGADRDISKEESLTINLSLRVETDAGVADSPTSPDSRTALTDSEMASLSKEKSETHKFVDFLHDLSDDLKLTPRM